MDCSIKGFPAYGFSIVLKFGGSIMRDLAVCKLA
ncbi:aspartate kinase, partial [Mesorhizobium sp. M7A.F.Ca.CA.001.06.1.1]